MWHTMRPQRSKSNGKFREMKYFAVAERAVRQKWSKKEKEQKTAHIEPYYGVPVDNT